MQYTEYGWFRSPGHQDFCASAIRQVQFTSIYLMNVIRTSHYVFFAQTYAGESSNFLNLAAMSMHTNVQLIAMLLTIPAVSNECFCSWALIPLTVMLSNSCLVYIYVNMHSCILHICIYIYIHKHMYKYAYLYLPIYIYIYIFSAFYLLLKCSHTHSKHCLTNDHGESQTLKHMNTLVFCLTSLDTYSGNDFTKDTARLKQAHPLQCWTEI